MQHAQNMKNRDLNMNDQSELPMTYGMDERLKIF